jgi:hypothetical protein
VVVTETVRFVRETSSVQKSTRGQYGKASRVIRRLFMCDMWRVQYSETAIVPC